MHLPCAMQHEQMRGAQRAAIKRRTRTHGAPAPSVPGAWEEKGSTGKTPRRRRVGARTISMFVAG